MPLSKHVEVRPRVGARAGARLNARWQDLYDLGETGELEVCRNGSIMTVVSLEGGVRQFMKRGEWGRSGRKARAREL